MLRRLPGRWDCVLLCFCGLFLFLLVTSIPVLTSFLQVWKCDPCCHATPRMRAVATLPRNPAQLHSQEVPPSPGQAGDSVLDVVCQC